MNKTNLPNNLYELRKKAGLSQEEFADRLNVSRQAVSKWERGEAYPDTENLITISEMFGVTIDELLKSENISGERKSENEAENKTDNSADNGYFRLNVGDKVKVDLNGGITVNDDDGTVKVNLGHNGITVNSDDGVKVKLGRRGIIINDDDDDDNDDDDDDVVSRENWKYSVLYNVPYSILCLVAFLVLGFTLNAWNWAWTLFMTVPVFDSVLDAIRNKSLSEFSYAVFVAFIYCLFGIIYKWWHPGWIIFITVPVFYSIAEAIDRYNAGKNRKEDT